MGVARLCAAAAGLAMLALGEAFVPAVVAVPALRGDVKVCGVQLSRPLREGRATAIPLSMGRIGSLGGGATKSSGYAVLKQVIGSMPRNFGCESALDLFTEVDRDASGQIDKEELREMFGKAGTIITDSQLAEIVRVVSSNQEKGEGATISWPDFASAVELVELQIQQELASNDVMNNPEF